MTNAKPKPNEELAGIPSGVTDPCVHCGFCLPTCASYRVLGTEMDSPRGRIHALKAIERGELKMDSTTASHFDTCLGCFACVTACPSGVRYDQLIEATRPKLNNPELRSPCNNLLREMLMMVLPYPNRLRKLLQTIRTYSASPIQKLMRNSGIINLLGPQIAAMEALLPPLSQDCFEDKFKIINPAQGKLRARVGLVLGCVQRCFDPAVNQATISVLQANGFEVVIPSNQGCCGAVSHHQGRLEQTKSLAYELIKSFNTIIGKGKAGGEEPLDAILIAASGCGHTMKEYQNLLEKESVFPCKIFDVHEFLSLKGLSDNFCKNLKPLIKNNGEIATKEKPIAVAFHDACHMIHGQGISNEPRSLLRYIPYLKIYEATEAGVCCGSAGIYNIVQPNEAAELGQLKVTDLTKTNAEIIASANIGCTLQLRRHILNNLKVAHPMELLAYSAGLQKIPQPKESRRIS